jgi:hypothetical protein
MPVQLFANNATTTLGAALGIGVLSLTVNTGDGALFPSPTGGDWFYATLESGANLEIVQVTARAGDVFTIVRAQEGTSDQSWSIGDTVELRITKAWLDRVHTLDSLPLASIGDVVGPASSVDSRVAMFDGTTGKLIKDSGLTLSGSNTGDQTLRIDSTLPFTDNTTGDFSTTKHGYVPKGTNVGHFLKDDGSWALPEPVGALPEVILNGSMQLWQRGTSFTSPASTSYIADRWTTVYGFGTGDLDMSQTALGDVAIHTATGQRLEYGMRTTVATAEAAVAATEFHLFEQMIEGNRALPYMHNEFTVSFWVRSSTGSKTYSFFVRNSGGPPDKSFVKTFTVDTANTWERKTITVPTQNQTGTWYYDERIGMHIGISLMAGANFHTTDNQWNDGNFLGVSGMDNFFDTLSRTFDITGVQIDLGPDALPYRGLPFDEDYEECLRYYQKSFAYATTPSATATGSSSINAASTSPILMIEYQRDMRVVPTTTFWNYNSGTSGTWYNFTATGNVTPSNNNQTTKRSSISFTGTISTGDQIVGHWELDAEL